MHIGNACCLADGDTLLCPPPSFAPSFLWLTCHLPCFHCICRPFPAAAAGAEAGEAADKPRVDETADKLDSLMELTFQHLQRRQAAGQLGAAWDTLLGAFERCVLLTHRSKFTQVGYPGVDGWPWWLAWWCV